MSKNLLKPLFIDQIFLRISFVHETSKNNLTGKLFWSANIWKMSPVAPSTVALPPDTITGRISIEQDYNL